MSENFQLLFEYFLWVVLLRLMACSHLSWSEDMIVGAGDKCSLSAGRKQRETRVGAPTLGVFPSQGVWVSGEGSRYLCSPGN